MVPGLFGSYAVGAVRCEPGRATVLTDDDLLRVVRCYLQAGSHAEDLLVRAGQTELCFRATAVLHVSKPSELVRELTNRMLAAEARLANRLSADCSALTLVDGPLRAGTTGRRVAGYIKRTANWYLGAEERAIFDDLGVGDRTPLFRLSVEGQAKRDRFSWYVRIADLGPHLHPHASVMRLETWATLPVEQAARLADECARTLPHLAGSLIRDPRAPQNLTRRQRTRGLAPPPSGQPRTVAALHRRGARRESHARSAPHDQERTGSMTERNAAMSGYTGSRTTPASPRSSRREEVGDAS